MNNKFNNVIDRNEELLWFNNSNPLAVIFNNIIYVILIIITIGSLICLIIGSMMHVNDAIKIDYLEFLKPMKYLLPLVLLFYIIVTYINTINSYLLITNKRIIKSSGIFNKTITSFNLKDLKSLNYDTSFMDSKNSGNLYLDFKSNKLIIKSLNDIKIAYNLLIKITSNKTC